MYNKGQTHNIMESREEILKKAGETMKQSLIEASKGNYEEAERLRYEANVLYDSVYTEMNTAEEMQKSKQRDNLYTESRNFGIIYNVFEQNLDKLFETKKGKNVIKNAYKLIKNNKVLNEQFKIYDFFENVNNVKFAKNLVNESDTLIKKFDKETIKKNNDKFIDFIKENKLDEFVDIDDETIKLYESISYLITNKKSFDNLNEYVNAQAVITENIENRLLNENKTNGNKVSFNEFEKIVSKEQEKVNENLNDDEKKLIDVFTGNSKDKKKIFEDYKRETLKLIQENISDAQDEEKEQWQTIYEKIESKKYSDSITENIVNCSEMLEITNELKD